MKHEICPIGTLDLKVFCAAAGNIVNSTQALLRRDPNSLVGLGYLPFDFGMGTTELPLECKERVSISDTGRSLRDTEFIMLSLFCKMATIWTWLIMNHSNIHSGLRIPHRAILIRLLTQVQGSHAL